MSLDMNEHGTIYECGPNSQICYVALLSLPPRPLVTSSLVPDLPRGVYMGEVFLFLEYKTASWSGRLFVTFFPGPLVDHSWIKLHQHKHLKII